MAEPGHERAPGWYRRLVALAVLGAVAVPALNGALWLQEPSASSASLAPPVASAGSSAASSGAPPVPRPSPVPAQVQNGASTSPPPTAVQDLVRQRSAAVVSGNRAAWLATVDDEVPGLVQRQGELFDRLAALRPSSWTYTVQDPDAVLAPDRQAALGGAAVLAHVQLRYRLAADAPEIERDQHLTLVRRSGRWLVGGDQDGSQQRDLWDLGPVTVSRSRRSVVVSSRDAPVPADRTANEADAAAARVDAVWGDAWPRSVVVMVPATVADMAILLDRTSTDGLSQLAAVTTGELRGDGADGSGSGRTTGDRVVLNPATFPDLTAVGRGVVLTHEFTHVATRAADVTAPPVWVDEGFADYVAYLDTSLGVRDVAGDLLDDPKALAGLRDLPKDSDFDPTQGRVGPAYAAAWLAMKFIATQGGTPMVVDFYRVAAGLQPLHTWPTQTPTRASLMPRTPLEHACAEVVGYLEPSFVRRWLVYVRARP